MSFLRVGLAQTDVKLGDRDGNFSRLEALLDAGYIPSSVDTVIVTPELMDVGYVIQEADAYGDKDALRAKEFLGSLAKKHRFWFAGGSVLALSCGKALNRALALTPDGNCAAYYDKAHLFPLMDEDKYLKAGNKRTLFNIGSVRAGMALCYDIRFCEYIRLYAVEGAQVLFISAEWPASRLDHWQTLLKARAIENMMFVVACNRCGTSDKTEFAGHSTVIDPWGTVLYEAGDCESLAFVDIDISCAEKARGFLKTLEARRPELYEESLDE